MLIGFMGIPGCGKSTTAREIASLLGAECFLEPEEDEWDDVVRNRDVVGAFTALSWFRNRRIPQLWEAKAESDVGRTVVIDSLYDKLIDKYIDDSSFDWLIAKQDPYYRVARQIARLDYHHLPDPDTLVFVYIDSGTWQEMIKLRGRVFDATANVNENFAMQHVMLAACEEYASQKGIKLLIHDQKFGTAAASAEDIRALIE